MPYDAFSDLVRGWQISWHLLWFLQPSMNPCIRLYAGFLLEVQISLTLNSCFCLQKCSATEMRNLFYSQLPNSSIIVFLSPSPPFPTLKPTKIIVWRKNITIFFRTIDFCHHLILTFSAPKTRIINFEKITESLLCLLTPLLSSRYWSSLPLRSLAD